MEQNQGDGVGGMYPILSEDMQAPFVYENRCPVSELGAQLKGVLEFRFMEGPRTGETFIAKVDPFTLDIDPGTALMPNPFFERWMHF